MIAFMTLKFKNSYKLYYLIFKALSFSKNADAWLMDFQSLKRPHLYLEDPTQVIKQVRRSLLQVLFHN